MADINFGLLQNMVANGANIPIKQIDAETQPENYRANLSADTQRMGILAQAGTAQAANATTQQRNANDFAIAAQNANIAASQATANSGYLASQTQAQNQKNQENQQGWDVHNQGMQAYNAILQSGGTPDKAMSALIQVTAPQDPAHALALQSDQEKNNQQLKDNNNTALIRAGNAVWNLNQYAQQQGTDLFSLVKQNPALVSQFNLPDTKTYNTPAKYASATAGLMGSATTAQQGQAQQYTVANKILQSNLDTQKDAESIRLTSQLNPESIGGAIAQRNQLQAAYAKLPPNSTEAIQANKDISLFDSSMNNKYGPSWTTIVKSAVGLTPSISYPQGSAAGAVQNLVNPSPTPNQQPQTSQAPGQQALIQQMGSKGMVPYMQNGQLVGFVPSGSQGGGQ